MKTKSFIIFLITASACNPVKNIPVSTTTKVVERLVPVEIPSDSSLIIALLECNENNEVILRELSEQKTAGTKTEFNLENGKLSYKTENEHKGIMVPVKDSIIVKEVPVQVLVEKVTNRLSPWQRFWVNTGYTLTIGLLIWLLPFIIKLIKKIL